MVMRRTWFTADLHLGHANILKYCLRPFLTPEEMVKAQVQPRARWPVSKGSVRRHDAALLQAINERVAADDTLWVLGDFSFYHRSDASYESRVKSYRRQIACKNLFLVPGNHDNDSVAHQFSATIPPGVIEVEGQEIYVDHEPQDGWDRQAEGAWHLHGHVHGRLAAVDRVNPSRRRCDVGVDVWEYCPVSFDELCDYMIGRG
jgi:calcineurin-like phosphoesterase family protein